MQAGHFQLSMIACNLNCWLERFERESSIQVLALTDRTFAVSGPQDHTRHGGQTEIHFGSQYQERDRFDPLLARLRSIDRKMDGFIPVGNTPLRA